MRWMSGWSLLLLSWLLSVQALGDAPLKGSGKLAPDDAQAIRVRSPQFREGERIPARFTCKGRNISPDLSWDNIPVETRSFVLLVEDPDASDGTWVHWVLYNIPPTTRRLPANISGDGELSSGALNGKNDFGELGYGGPCPPSGQHHYYFRLYALDTVLKLKPGRARAEVVKAMKGHVLAEGALMGVVEKE